LRSEKRKSSATVTAATTDPTAENDEQERCFERVDESSAGQVQPTPRATMDEETEESKRRIGIQSPG
jgi:hypothetical protein